MTFVIVLFTILLVLDCLLLGLLILIQLPKKEAGAGVAFGSGATDALFGAGSGTALTKLTRNAAIAFFVLVLGLCVLNSANRSGTSNFNAAYDKAAASVATPPPGSAPSTLPAPPAGASSSTNAPAIPLTITSNSISAPKAATNPPAK